MHPAHLTYLIRHPLNSLDYLFAQLDKLQSEARQSLLFEVNGYIMRPTYPDASFDYKFFKAHCHEIVASGAVEQCILTFFIVSYTLQTWLALDDKTSVDDKLANLAEEIPKLRKAFEEVKPKNSTEQWLMENHYSSPQRVGVAPEDRTLANMLLEINQKIIINNLPQRVEDHYGLYVYFCKTVVEQLLLENYLPDQDM